MTQEELRKFFREHPEFVKHFPHTRSSCGNKHHYGEGYDYSRGYPWCTRCCLEDILEDDNDAFEIQLDLHITYNGDRKC